MKCSIIIAVLESYEVVIRQIKHFSKFLTKEPFLSSCELIIVDDGSRPTILGNIIKEFSYNWKDIYCNVSSIYRLFWFYDMKELFGFNFILSETNDFRPWTQPLARNKGASIASGDYLYFTDIDHILTEESILSVINFKGDKMEFSRTWAILDEDGTIIRDRDVLIDYGCKENDLNKTSSHCNTFAIKKEIFNKLDGYDQKFCGKYGGDDVDFNKRYAELHYKGEIKSSEKGPLIFVYPDPRRDKKKIFHSLRNK
jgi:predicted glycosyltransferase involved in capsule biosynthesis